MKNLRHLSEQEIEDLVLSLGEKKFRAAQLQEWIWKKNIPSIEYMSNLPKAFREKLQENYTLNKVVIHQLQQSADGTVKNKFQLHDKHFIEGVLIPSGDRMTACVSSQVGCSLACKFCATGYMERERNVDFDEIYDQVQHINDQAMQYFQKPLSNIVYMGMGEPMLNFSNVLKSIDWICSEKGMAMSPKRITVSTAGIAKMIMKLADENPRVNLALSLHAATDEKRNEIMPINESNNLKSLIAALDYYFMITKNPITFEYILFNNFNDTFKDAEQLIKLCRRIPSKVNIIEYNSIDLANFEKPDINRTMSFMDFLSKNNVNARLRRSRGKDIDAACGQLANKK